jgi:DNA helicase-2/ATP-dependent DNA helicase PcrA
MSREYVLNRFQAPVNLQIDYAKELNPQQYAAVTAPPGPSLVIAGAGSGKTRTLIYRVGFLLENGIPPDRILLLTFTNKAAKEMMGRVSDLLGQELGSLWGGTFHAIGNRVLRAHAEKLGFGRDFTILDREDAEDMIGACLGESEIDVKETRFPKAEVLGDIFSLSVNTGRTALEVVTQQYPYFMPLSDDITALQVAYRERKLAANAMDFDDLLYQWLRLLKEHEDVREHYQRRFQFILVDEYQDTNRLQGDLIDLLAARHHNLMVVGDDAQSIYSWRGADFRNILKFPERHPDAKVYRIETNYRSTPEVLLVANAAIAANAMQFEKTLEPARKAGMKPALVPCPTAGDQAVFVAQRMLELREEGIELNKMAVLYRSHFHALELQLELVKRQIPFTITSGIRFFEQAHVKDVAAHLKLVVNPRDELSFKRVAQLLPGVGPKAADKLWTRFQEARAEQPAAGGKLAVAMQKASSAVPKKAATAWAQLTATMSQLEEPPVKGKPSKMIQLVLEAGYEDYLKGKYANYRNRGEDLEQLAAFAQQFSGIEEFLTQVALLSNLEAEEDRPRTRDDEAVRLSTIHQAKGLEFDVVFVIMLCEGLFPSARSMEMDKNAEEERRLFYVAVTRARNELYLSYPLVRTLAGGTGEALQQPSRFLAEIPRELLDEWNLRPFSAYG